MDKRIGVYAIEINNKYYIGSSENAKSRLKNHLFSLSRGKHPNEKLQKAFNKHGLSDAMIIKNLKKKSHLFYYECYYIGIYNSIENGYNKYLPISTTRKREVDEIAEAIDKELFSIVDKELERNVDSIKWAIKTNVNLNSLKRSIAESVLASYDAKLFEDGESYDTHN